MDNAKNSGDPPNAFVEAVRQITTPITAISLIVVSLSFIISSIAKCELDPHWKGSLLAAVLTILSGVLGAFFYMAIKMPKNLTFDKEAHLAVSVNVSPGEAAELLGFAQALAKHGKDSQFVEELAKQMAQQKSEPAGAPAAIAADDAGGGFPTKS